MMNGNCMLFLMLISASVAQAQVTCSNGVIVYVKSSATSVELEVKPDRTVEVSKTESPTTTCHRLCNGTPSCSAFTVDYTSRSCKLYSSTIQNTNLLSRLDSALYEKTCLQDLSEDRFHSMCNNRMWAVEMVRGGSFNGAVMRVDPNVPSRITCARICLTEIKFDCASATYDSIARTCALSAEDRHTQPSSFELRSTSTDYLENQCISDLRDCQFLRHNDYKVISVDYITSTTNEERCREDCNKNGLIICRAYSYNLSDKNCYLSSDDSVSLRGIELPTEEGLRYAERRCQHGASVAQQNNPLTFAAQTLSPYSGFDQRVNPRNPFNDNFYPSPFSPVPYGGGGGGVGFGDTSFRTGVQYPTSRTVPPYSTSFNYLNTGFGYPYPGYSNFGIPSGSPYVPFNPYDNTGGGFNPNNPFVGNRNFPTGVGIATPTTGIFSNTGRITPITTNAGFPFASPDKCTFEKSAGLVVNSEPKGLIPSSPFGRGITTLCSNWCRLQGPLECPAYTLDYSTNQCTVLSRPADTALSPAGVQGRSYFEQVCFSNRYPACDGKLWAFERFVQSELRGYDDRVLPSIGNIHECEEACLKETQFLCLSAEYDRSRFECRLSRESRLSRPFSFQQTPTVDYLENQCGASSTFSTCSPQRQDGQAILQVDAAMTQVYTEDECRRYCQTFPNFTCNAASYRQTTNECLLSGSVTTIVQPNSVLLYTSCLQPTLVTLPTSFGNNFGQGFGPTSIDGQYPTSVGGFGFNPQTSFNPNQFYGGFTPATSSGTLPFNTQTFNQGFQPQIPQVYGIQSPNERRFNIGQLPSSAGLSPLFPTAAQVPFNGQFPATTSQFGTPGQFLTGGGGVGGSQFPTTGQIPTTTTITTGQFLIPGQFPIAGQSPTYGQSPTIAGQFPTLGQLPSQSQFPTPGHLPTSPPFSATSQLAPINDQSLLIRTPENLPLVPQPHLQDSDIGFTRQRSPIGRTTSATTRFIRLEPVQKRNTRENDQPVGRTL